jgi:ribose transport system ATP-binding protein
MGSAGTVSVLALDGLTKTFEGQRALDDLDIELRAGEIHALLGQNGSGKSTLIKLLAGYHRPTSVACAVLHGTPFELGSSAAARQGGMHFIHQDLGLVDEFDAADNLALGTPYEGRWWISDRRERGAARALCERYGLSIDVAAPVGTLTPAEQTQVAIARALRSGIEGRMLLVLDEPTAALPAHEVDRLFSLLREVRARGATVLYVTHRLAEVFEIADRVTVIRDGRRIATRATVELDHEQLLALIIGRSIDVLYPDPSTPDGEVVLSVQGLRGGRVREASLDVHRGEIVGVTGLVGSGYEDLLRVIFDPSQRRAGEIEVEGERLAGRGIGSSISHRLGFVPADRKRLGGIAPWTVRENLTLPALKARRWLGTRAERAEARRWLHRLAVTPADPERQFASLSGGNQQKVVLARWLRCGAGAYLLEEPTNGVDVGAKQAIYASLATVTGEGAAVLMSSTDTEELCAICDRVVVMRHGFIRAVLRQEHLTEDRLRSETVRDDEGGAFR